VTFKMIVVEERYAIPSDWRRVLAKFPDDLREAWEERAAIIQYDGLEPRPTAERRALECITRAYEEATALLMAHFPTSPHAECGPVGETSAMAAGGRSL
jgi:hypothetical protein